MTNIPFEKQRLPLNPVEQIELKIAQGRNVSGDELLYAIEQSQGYQLDDRLRDVVRKFSISVVKRRGRPSNCRGREDFALAELDARYPALLRKHKEKAQLRRRSAAAEGTILADAEPTPSELAYGELLRAMQADFPNIDWRALRNKHTDWKNGGFHSAENHVDSEDFDAEIERLFPASQPRRS
jgi:hypothetical protein